MSVCKDHTVRGPYCLKVSVKNSTLRSILRHGWLGKKQTGTIEDMLTIEFSICCLENENKMKIKWKYFFENIKRKLLEDTKFI